MGVWGGAFWCILVYFGVLLFFFLADLPRALRFILTHLLLYLQRMVTDKSHVMTITLNHSAWFLFFFLPFSAYIDIIPAV